MKWLVIFTCTIAAALAAHKCCPQPESAGKCDCCPDACCCMCSNVTIPGVTAMPTTTPSAQTTTTSEVCELFGLDVVFVIDGSSSLTRTGWEIAMNFSSEVVASDIWVEVGVKTRFAFVKFGSDAEIVWDLTDPIGDSVATLQAGFINESYPRTFTNTGKGLDLAANILDTGDRDDDLYPDLVIVITDGKTNEDPALFNSTVARVQSLTDLIYVIGIDGAADGIELAELEFIAGSPDNVFTVDSISTLIGELDDILRNVFVRLCDTISPPGTTTPEPQITTTLPPQVVETCKCCCPPNPKKEESCGCY